MEFNQLVIQYLLPILQKEGFKIVEESMNNVRFESSSLKINVVFNDYEKSNFIEIGRPGETLYPLNDKTVSNIFKSELPINQVTPEDFVKNLAFIFQLKEGREILKGNIIDLIKFTEQESNDYTFELVQRQTLEKASEAWRCLNYKDYIESVDKLDFEKISETYQQRYRIAKQRLKK